ncbi:hypothetical protein GCM10027271_02600 [Saccharopolyspora gloriosae]|uniref:Uncharacterized protein n=1 Tax=Saccharopolyspora gloriosae TaxID=455344 RepID=A0A840NL67_9PSEU|nr:hypothetical protein [Saccharopolyspora gloriosae]MBB5071811.1 hypothetical protein [Saccharopolyspora gloriosae]
MPKVSVSWAVAVAALIGVVLVVMSSGEPNEPRRIEVTGEPMTVTTDMTWPQPRG